MLNFRTIMKRLFDITLSLISLALLFPGIALVAVLVRCTSKGPILYVSDRIGKNNVIFKMYKFRTMKTNAPAVATHLLYDANRWLTPVGNILRKTSLDELPQLWNILLGKMSFVGPRPALFNQHDLIELRTQREIHKLTPGLTGWAQINRRDELLIAEKVEYDAYYQAHRSFCFDLMIIILTVWKVVRCEDVSH